MLFRSGALEFSVPAVTGGQPGQGSKQPICKAESRSLKSDFGHTADVAETVAFHIGIVPEQFDLDSNTARYRTSDLRREQAVICPGCRPQHLPDFALLPIVTSDQSYSGGIARLDLFKFSLRKVHDHKSMCT